MKIYHITQNLAEAVDIKRLADGSWGLVDTETGKPFNSNTFRSAGDAEEFRDRTARSSPRPAASNTPRADTPNNQRTPSRPERTIRSGPNKGAVITDVDANGKLSGRNADGTEFSNKTAKDLRGPNAASKIRRISGKILKFAQGSTMFGLTSALQVFFIWQDAADKLAEIEYDMENFRFSDTTVRQKYYDAQMARVNKAKWVNSAVTVLANLAGIIGTSRAMTVVRALTMFTRFGGPIGWIISTLLFALTQGAVFLLSWTISKYGEEMANWIWDSCWEVLKDGASGAVSAAGDLINNAADIRGTADIPIDRKGRLRALQQDLQDGISLDARGQEVADALGAN